MNPCIGRQFGMEGASDAPILFHGDRFLVAHRQDFHLRTQLFESGCSDENPFRFAGCWPGTPMYRVDEGVNLSAIGIALDRNIDERPAARILSLISAHQNCSGTGSEQRKFIVLDSLANRCRKAMDLEQMTQGGTFASGHDQMRHALQLVRCTHFDGIAAGRMERMKMRLH